MGEDVRVPLDHVFGRERPVVLGVAVGVVVVQEGDALLLPPPHHARGLVVLVGQSPVLSVFQRLLQDAFGGHVERVGVLSGAVDPVDDSLSVRVLVVAQIVEVVLHVVPVLADAHVDVDIRKVVLHVFGIDAGHKVEAEAPEADVVLHPQHPLDQIVFDEGLGVVYVRSTVEEFETRVTAFSMEVSVVRDDRRVGPAELAAEHVVHALFVLKLRASVVDHDIRVDVDVVRVE